MALPQMKIRFLETETQEWIKQQAKINKRSLNAEINYHLEQAMLKQQKETTDVSPTTQAN